MHVEFFPFSGCEPMQAGGSLTCGPGGIRAHVDRVVCSSNDKQGRRDPLPLCSLRDGA